MEYNEIMTQFPIPIPTARPDIRFAVSIKHLNMISCALAILSRYQDINDRCLHFGQVWVSEHIG